MIWNQMIFARKKNIPLNTQEHIRFNQTSNTRRGTLPNVHDIGCNSLSSIEINANSAEAYSISSPSNSIYRPRGIFFLRHHVSLRIELVSEFRIYGAQKR